MLVPTLVSSSLSASEEGEGQQPGAGTRVCRMDESFPCRLGFEPSTRSFTLQKDYLCLAAYSFLVNGVLNFKMRRRCWQMSVLRRSFIFFITCIAFLCLATRYQLFKVRCGQARAQRATKETWPWCPSGVGVVSLLTNTGGEEKGMRWLWSFRPLPLSSSAV